MIEGTDAPATATLTPTSNAATPTAGINAELAAQLHALFDAPGASDVPSGVLAWWGNTSFPSGVPGAPALSQQDWENGYTRLETAAIAPGLLPALASLSALTNQFRADGPVPIAIANVALSVTTPEFAARATEAANAGRALDPAPRSLAEVTTGAHAFLAGALLHGQFNTDVAAVRTRAVTFVVDERFYCTNPGAPLPDAIELDLGDGRPARTVTFGQRVTASYPSGNSATVTVRCRYGATTLEARMTLVISDQAVAPIPDDRWSLYGNPSGNTGTAYVWRAPGHADVVNPLVVCEGFPGGYPYDYIYDAMAHNGMLAELHTRGYDLIVVQLDDGTDKMQDNADVMVSCIRQALGRARKANGVALPLVVGGLSMGGLIARYALALMEARGIPHGARLFFSVDSPHGGAYTSVADQWLLHYLAPASSLGSALAALVDSPADQQFLQLWVRDGEAIESPLRTQFLRDLEGIGSWPKTPRLVGIANGRGDGVRGVPARAPILEWSGSPFASARLFALPESSEPQVIGEAYCFRANGGTAAELRVATPISWEGAPGGLNVYNAMTAQVAQGMGLGAINDDAPVFTAISTLSALGIDPATVSPFAPVPPPGSGASPFHAYIAGTENTRHIVMTAAASTFLLAELGTPEVGAVTPASTSAAPAKWDPMSFDPHAPDFSRNPYPTYANFRKYAPVHWVDPYESYWVFRHEDVNRVLHDTEDFTALTFAKNRVDPPSAPPPAPFDVLANMPEGLFFLDPPRHGDVRGALDSFLARAMADAPVVSALIARQLLVSAKQSGRVELLMSYALPLPSSVLMTVMGIPQQDWSGIIGWVGAIQAGHDITQPVSLQGAAGTCAMAMSAYFQALMRGTTTSGCPFHAKKGRLFDMMVTEGMGAAPKLSPEEVQSSSVNLAIAGYLSTTFLIATGMLNLLGGDPALRAAEPAPTTLPIDLLRANPALLPSAIDEMLRYDSPFQMTDRFVVNKDVTLGGVHLRRGDPVTVNIGSANRDEAVFEHPETFDITRTGQPHIAFGTGIHRCFGAPLVERVAPAAFAMLLQELKTIELAGTPQ
ncbi:MAG: cytochrome P450, partial [Gemmatimonadaceae bacterium]